MVVAEASCPVLGSNKPSNIRFQRIIFIWCHDTQNILYKGLPWDEKEFRDMGPSVCQIEDEGLCLEEDVFWRLPTEISNGFMVMENK